MSADRTPPAVSEARIRRVPKYGVFLVFGGGLGLITAAILTFAFDGTSTPSAIGVTYSPGAVFGFLALFCAVCGVAVGAIVALILDKVAGRRTHTVTIERETFTED